MPAVYLGDELTAAGYRLAGFDTIVPMPGGEADALARASAQADLILVAAGIATRIGDGTMQAATAACRPLTLVVPDLSGTEPPDIAARLRTLLGLDAGDGR